MLLLFISPGCYTGSASKSAGNGFSSLTRLHDFKQSTWLSANESLSFYRLVISVAFVTVLLKIQQTTWITLMEKNVSGDSLLTVFLTCQTRFILKPRNRFWLNIKSFISLYWSSRFCFSVSYRSKSVGNVYEGGEIVSWTGKLFFFSPMHCIYLNAFMMFHIWHRVVLVWMH